MWRVGRQPLLCESKPCSSVGIWSVASLPICESWPPFSSSLPFRISSLPFVYNPVGLFLCGATGQIIIWKCRLKIYVIGNFKYTMLHLYWNIRTRMSYWKPSICLEICVSSWMCIFWWYDTGQTYTMDQNLAMSYARIRLNTSLLNMSRRSRWQFLIRLTSLF